MSSSLWASGVETHARCLWLGDLVWLEVASLVVTAIVLEDDRVVGATGVSQAQLVHFAIVLSVELTVVRLELVVVIGNFTDRLAWLKS